MAPVSTARFPTLGSGSGTCLTRIQQNRRRVARSRQPWRCSLPPHSWPHARGRAVLTTASGHKTLSHVPGIDEWLILDKRWDRSGLRSYGRVMSRLIAGRFDAAVAAQRSVRTGMFVRLSGAPLRVGFAGAPGAWAYNRKVEWEPGKHAVRRYLELSAPLGGDPRSADPQPALSVAPPAARRADALLRASGVDPEQELICIAPGSVWGTKRWIPEGFAAVVDASPSMGLTPVLIGSPDELELCRTVSRLSTGGATVLAGVTDIPELVALLARSRILVGNDSGAAHVAAAVGTPVCNR